MRGMIFAAGLGTRLKPLTDKIPKALVPINGKPLLAWQIEKMQAAGIKEIIINIHHFPEQIIRYVQEQKWESTIVFSDEREQLLETGGGLLKAWRAYPDEQPMLVMNVDILSNLDIPTLLSCYREEDLGLLVVSRRETQRYFCFEDERLVGWTNIATGAKRPESLEVEGKRLLAFSGCQVLNARILPYLEQMGCERFSIVDAYLHIVERDPEQVLRAYVPEKYRMMDVGKIDHLAEAEAFAAMLLPY